jgi:uncharacterized protein YecE (DUF72 family)
MAKYYSDIKKTFEFVIKLLEKITERRETELLTERCEAMRRQIHLLNSVDKLKEFRLALFNLIEELKFIIQAEIRFFLFPLPDIKQETYELGKKYMNNFLEWFKPEENISVEEVLKFLNEEIYLLDEARKILEKIDLPDRQAGLNRN